jgi:hypothetical protein
VNGLKVDACYSFEQGGEFPEGHLPGPKASALSSC